MELFSEIYSRYYTIAELLLEAAQDSSLTETHMSQIITQYGFGESNLFLLPKLISGEYALFESDKGNFSPRVSHSKGYPLSFLQRSFLKALLRDPRLRLFLTDSEQIKLETALQDVTPLFSWSDFYYFDRFLDGDPYESELYRENFRIIFQALKEHHTLRLLYQSGHGKQIQGIFAPYRLQYSQKDDCFRLLCAEMSYGKPFRSSILNLARVEEAAYALCDYPTEAYLEKLLFKNYSEEPVLIEIHDERNALERCMLHFASYEKQTTPTDKPGIYQCRLFYNKDEETELLIRVLSFGPVLRVLGPEPFLNQVKERVARQAALLVQTEE